MRGSRRGKGKQVLNKNIHLNPTPQGCLIVLIELIIIKLIEKSRKGRNRTERVDGRKNINIIGIITNTCL